MTKPEATSDALLVDSVCYTSLCVASLPSPSTCTHSQACGASPYSTLTLSSPWSGTPGMLDCRAPEGGAPLVSLARRAFQFSAWQRKALQLLNGTQSSGCSLVGGTHRPISCAVRSCTSFTLQIVLKQPVVGPLPRGGDFRGWGGDTCLNAGLCGVGSKCCI